MPVIASITDIERACPATGVIPTEPSDVIVAKL